MSPVRVELMPAAVDGLVRYAESGNLSIFLKRLVHLEEGGRDAGQPLGGALEGWRKIVVGDRNWRIIYRMSADGTVASVWLIADRADAACYEEAERRVQAHGRSRPEARSLAAVMLAFTERERQRRQDDRRPR